MKNFTARLCIALFLVSLQAVNAQKPVAPAAGKMHWVTAWMCATQQIYKGDAATYTEFHDQTVRTFLHPSLGGKTIRLKLSGSSSSNSTPIDSVTIGLRSGNGNSIAAGSIRPVTFNGNKSINVPAGATIWSDPLQFSFDAFQDVVVSLHVPEYTGQMETGHARAISSNLILAGDQTNTESVPAAPAPKGVGTNYFLQSIDVLADEHTYALVAFGDSITDGIQATWGANHRWPDYLATRFAAAHGTITSANIAVLNAGISGNRLLHDYTGPSAFSRLNRDTLEQSGVRFVFLLEGINDINRNADNPKGLASQVASADEIIWAYQQIAMQLHAAGIKLVVGTLTPEKGIAIYGPQTETDRMKVNQWIRNSKIFDGVIDFDAAVRDPADQKQFLPAYDSGDHIHPSDAGYKTMAEAIDIRAFLNAYLPGEILAGKADK